MKKNVWNSVTDRADAHELILTGEKNTAVLQPDNFILDEFYKLKTKNNVLDFGCGVGRNSFMFMNQFKNVHSFDYPNMIEFLKSDERYDSNKITTYTNWDDVIINKFDLVSATLVFQHIEIDLIHSYLKDIANCTKYFFITSRWYMDFAKNDNILNILKQYFDIVKINIPEDEILKANGYGLNNELHFNALLKPKNKKEK